MKTKNFVLTVFAVLFAATTFATKLPTMKIVPVEAEKTIVSFESATPSHFELTVKNTDGKTLYYKKSESPVQNYRTLFDFSEMGTGRYRVNLSYGNCTLCRNVTITGHEVNVGEEVRLFSPVYSFENNRLNVSFLNKAQKNVFLNVYQDGEHVTGTKLGKEICIQKTVDFSKLGNGTYEVVLSDRHNDYTYVVNK